MTHRIPFLLGIAGGLFGCSGDDPNAFHVGCGQPVSVQVSEGVRPTIGWSPACEVGSVVVAEYAGSPTLPPPGDTTVPTPPMPGGAGAVVWKLDSPPAGGGPNNLIRPTVRYGEAPRGLQGSVPVALEPGRPYVVLLWRHTANGTTQTVGTGRFQP